MPKQRLNDPSRAASLTPMQREVLRLVPELGTSKLIADRLGIEPSSVDKTIQRAMVRLDAPNRAVAASMLREYEVQQASGKPDSPSSVAEVSGFSPLVAPKSTEPNPASRDLEGAVSEERQPYFAVLPPRPTLLQRLLDPEERHDLTTAQRLRRIAFWMVAGVLGLCLLGLILGKLGEVTAALLIRNYI